jgi:hypothetical protein
MARVTAAEVREIMDNCTLTDIAISPFIGGATEIVSKVFANDTSITTALLKEIERWFAAHMIASTVFRTTSEEKLGDASLVFTGKWEEGLKSTPYGQMVLTIDVTGLMANTGKMAASIYAVNEFDE